MNNTTEIEFLADTKLFTNHCTPAELEVKVGAPCTISGYTDRHGGTIMKVYKNYVLVRKDQPYRVDSNGASEDQWYRFTPGSNDPKDWERFNLRKDGKYYGDGRLTVGVRNAYHDYSF